MTRRRTWRRSADAADALLIDALVPGKLGGTGTAIPWTGLGESLDAMTIGHRIVLAGGLTPDNVAEAIDYVSPNVVDVSSGVEVVARHQGSRSASARSSPRARDSRSSDMSSSTHADADRFGAFGGRYVPETLIPALDELEAAYAAAQGDPAFRHELSTMLSTYVGRPSPLSEAPRLSERVGARVLLKREDLNHTGAHKINNTVGQVLLARRMGKQRIIAETGAGQHGVATATVCARYGLECVVYMGEEDMRRQSLNVFRMRLMGATVIPVTSGTRTLKDATSEAIRDWVTNVTDTHYIIGSVVGPAPYPRMVRDFQAIIGVEARAQVLERVGRLPRTVVACVGGGSNAMGIFHAFVPDAEVELIGVEAAGEGTRVGAALRVAVAGDARRAARRAELSAPGRRRAGASGAFDLRGPRLPGRWARSTPSSRTAVARRTSSVTDDEALRRLPDASAGWKGSFPRWRPRTRWRGSRASVPAGRHDDVVLLCVSGRGDKDVAQVMEMGILDA